MLGGISRDCLSTCRIVCGVAVLLWTRTNATSWIDCSLIAWSPRCSEPIAPQLQRKLRLVVQNPRRPTPK